MTQLSRWLLRDEMVRSPSERTTHTYVIGQPGTGKSRALESWIMQDIAAGHGVGVIDPHGDLFNNLILRLSSMPQVWERIVIIDPCNPDWVTTFNPLEAVSGYSQERLSLFLTDIIGKIWRVRRGRCGY
jgi:DNA helicase HerA-like ATPase